MQIEQAWLEPTWFIDSDSPEIETFASEAAGDTSDPTEIAIRLFHAVRDGYRYDPYNTNYEPEAFRASTIVNSDGNWCVPKSVLLTAAARNRGIPARLGYADVKNHLTSEKLAESMGTDVFFWHGYSELLLNGRWYKLSTAFNIELCERFGVKVLEFDGTDDALMHPFDEAGNRHMEYVNQRGSFDDLPLDDILETFREFYPNLGGGGQGAAAAGDDAFT
ncbi:MAG: transglutaminase family protein [Actinomycetia bacterium]|nr:transglutaminase family protein [Actinomycetes bacterium]MCP4960550.1 transglutaminase family protein [Actinomycetes bacterium]